MNMKWFFAQLNRRGGAGGGTRVVFDSNLPLSARFVLRSNSSTQLTQRLIYTVQKNTIMTLKGMMAPSQARVAAIVSVVLLAA